MINTFAGLLESLARNQVKFALVGGLAVALNGFDRTTRDVDILIDNSPGNISRLTASLAEFGEGLGRDLRPEEVPNEPGAIRITENFDLDIFVQMSGKTLSDYSPMLKQYTFPSGVQMAYLNSEGLMETKRGSVRYKDQADIGALRDIQLRGQSDSPPPLDSFRDPTPPEDEPSGDS